jgi:hypothetical protein
MKCRRRHEVRQCFISDGPACVQEVALKAARADYWWKRQSCQRGRWDIDLSGLEEMLVDLYADFGWEIEEAEA